MSNGSETSSTTQRLLIGAATLIVIVLTVAAAIFLALPPGSDEPPTVEPVTPTTIVQNPTVTPSPTPISADDTPTPSPTPPPQTETITPGDTATATSTTMPDLSSPSPTILPTGDTPTRTVITVTATSAPATATPNPCAPPQGWVEYVVRPGDTLNSLAQKTGISPTDLQQINCLASSVLQPGQVIYLPFIPPDPTVTNTTTTTPSPTSTRPSTPTPIAPIIDEVDARDVAIDNPDLREIIVIAIGRNFRPREAGFKAELTGPTLIRLDVDLSSSDTSLRATKLITGNLVTTLQPGTYDLIITNPDGRSDIANGVYPRGTPTPTPPAPNIADVSPSAGRISEQVTLTITGQNFIPRDINVQLQRSTGDGTTFDLDVDGDTATATSLRAIIRANQLPETGRYDLIVINRDNQRDLEEDAFTATN